MVIGMFAIVTFVMWAGGPGYVVGATLTMFLFAIAALIATGFRRRWAMLGALSAAAFAAAASHLALISFAVAVRALLLEGDVMTSMTALVLAAFAAALWSLVCQIVRSFPFGWKTPVWGRIDPERPFAVIKSPERGLR